MRLRHSLLVVLTVGLALAGDDPKTSDGKLPDTSGWKVLFADDFNRPAIGDRWKSMTGDWKIDDGALMGELKGPANSDYRDAVITLKDVVMPRSVEITYEVWFPVELGSEVKILTDNGEKGFFAILMGTDGPYLKKGSTIMLHKDKDSYQPIDHNTKCDVAVDKRHKMRIVLHDDHVTLFADGQRVSSAHLPDLKTFGPLKLNLVATWGGESSLIFYDNLELRVPPG